MRAAYRSGSRYLAEAHSRSLDTPGSEAVVSASARNYVGASTGGGGGGGGGRDRRPAGCSSGSFVLAVKVGRRRKSNGGSLTGQIIPQRRKINVPTFDCSGKKETARVFEAAAAAAKSQFVFVSTELQCLPFYWQLRWRQNPKQTGHQCVLFLLLATLAGRSGKSMVESQLYEFPKVIGLFWLRDNISWVLVVSAGS